MKLTEQQQKMAVEFFAQKAAEEAPGDDQFDWQSRYEASLAIGRQIMEFDWSDLLDEMIDLQSFSRDAAGWLNEKGYDDTAMEREYWGDFLEDRVSWLIDQCVKNSGA